MGSFGQVVRHPEYLKDQLEAIREEKRGLRSGVVVELYHKDMRGFDPFEENQPWAGKRVWMTAEYTVLTPQEVEVLKKKWDAAATE